MHVLSQSTDLIFKVKGTKQFHVTISFTSKDGVEGVTADEFIDYDRVYFTIKPNSQSEREYFKEGDIQDDLLTIRLTQDYQTIARDPNIRPIPNTEGKVDQVVFAYIKRDVWLYKPFVFITPFDTAAPIQLTDEYFKYFNTYAPIFETGSNQCDQKKYIEAYNTFMKIIKEATKNEEIKHYSFYQYASETLIETAIEQYNDSLVRCLERINNEFSKNFSEKKLNQCDSLISKLKEGYRIFTPYMQLDFPNSAAYLSKYDKLLLEADSLSEYNHVLFKNKKMQFLETGKYSDYKFRLFVDLLAKIVTDLSSIKQLNGLDTLNIKVLDKFLSKKEELVQMSWLNDFQLLITLVNKDIKDRGKVFSDSVMANFQRQSAFQPQPYHTIFLGFNELERNQMLFKSYLNEAIKSCTDLTMISNLEMWFQSYNATFEGLSNEIIDKINDGIGLVSEKKWDEAAFVFDILTKQAGNVSVPWYYSGLVLYEKGEPFAAELKFNVALERYPKYIAPRLYIFNLMNDSGRFTDLLPKITETLSINDIWLFHFWFAQTLIAIQKYDEAIEALNNTCIKMNPYDEQGYFLLGDAYLAKKNYVEAENAYKKTNEVNPYFDTKIFNQKMKLLQESKIK